MLKKQKIKKMFEEMGLGKKKERERFIEFAKEDSESNFDSKYTYKYSTTTSIAEDKEDAELA